MEKLSGDENLEDKTLNELYLMKPDKNVLSEVIKRFLNPTDQLKEELRDIILMEIFSKTSKTAEIGLDKVKKDEQIIDDHLSYGLFSKVDYDKILADIAMRMIYTFGALSLNNDELYKKAKENFKKIALEIIEELKK